MTDRRFWLSVKAALASLYFAAMFFVLTPGAILYYTRENPLALSGYGTAILGVVMIALANLLVAKLVGEFIRRGDGTHVPIDPPRLFVESSLYAWSRNPMYLAYIVVAIGEALLFGSLALLAYAVILWTIAHLYVVYREEPLLRRRFGEEYHRYCGRVPRWGFGRGQRRQLRPRHQAVDQHGEERK